jgi:plastocyanin
MALAVAMTLSFGAAPTRPDQAAAADCAWKRVAKRMVKHVRRHGKVRKVVRRKQRWVCVPRVAVPIAAPPAPAPAPANPPPASEPEPEANRLSVRAAEFYFVLSRPSVKVGEVTIELNNQGEDPHNLNLRLQGETGEPLQIEETDSLQRRVADFSLPAGEYRLWCSLPEHEEDGMEAALQVE